MAAILRDDPPEMEGSSKPIPLALRRIIDHCLEKVPARRFRDAHDVAFALENLSSSEGPAPISAPFAPQNLRTTRIWATLAVLMVISAGWLGWGLRGGLFSLWPVPPPSNATVAVRLLTYTGHDGGPAASPDGRTIAFSSDRDGRSRIWLKQLKGGGEVALTTGTDTFPRFSPDGSSVLFVRTEGNDTSLYRVGLLGGDPRKVAARATSGDWSPKGDQIVFMRDRNDGPQFTTAIMLVAASGGSERQLAEVRGQLVLNPRWSPDGRSIAFTNASIQQGGGVGKVFLVDVGTGALQVFDSANKYGSVSSLAWISPEEFLYFQSESVTGNGVSVSPSRAYRQDARTGASQPVFWSPTSGKGVDLLPDGRVVFDGMAGRQNLREYSLTKKGDPRWLTRGNINDRQPVYSRDGEWVIFSSNRTGNLNLWAVSPKTGTIRNITDDAKTDWDPGLSVDGKHLLWGSDRSGVFEFWMANLDGTEAHQLTHDGEDAENPTQTRDGNWVVYMGGNAQHPGLWKIHPDGTGATCLVAGTNMVLPEVSPDGKYVAYLHGADTVESRIEVVRVEDGAPVPFVISMGGRRNAVVTVGRCRWTPDGRHLVFTSTDDRGHFGVAIQDFEPGRDTRSSRRSLAGFDPDWITESLGISPDGTKLVLSESERVFSVMVAEGATGLAPRRGKGK
jgi:Tol biopolymer transport system component